MNTNLSRWSNELLGQIIEGASDAFLIVAGGSAALQSTTATPPLDLKHIGVSMAFGAGIYAASFLKKTPTPASMPPLPIPASQLSAPAPAP